MWRSCLGNFVEQDYQLILSPAGWLDCPDNNFYKNPQFSVKNLSGVCPPQAFEIKEMVP